MKLLLRKLICLNLALVMLLGMLPAAFAAEEAKPALWLRIDGVDYDAKKAQVGKNWSYQGYSTFGYLTLTDYTGGAISTNMDSLSVDTKGVCTITAPEDSAAIAGKTLYVTVQDGTAEFSGGKNQPALRAETSVTLSTKAGAALVLQGGDQASAVSADNIYARMPGDILAVGGGAAAYQGSFNLPRYRTTTLLTGDSRQTLKETETFTGSEIAVRLVQTTVSVIYYDCEQQPDGGQDYRVVRTQTQPRGVSAKLNPPEPIAWEGYTFAGWADGRQPSKYTRWYEGGSAYDFESELSVYAIREKTVTGDGAVLALDAGSGSIVDKNLPKTTLTAEKEEKDGVVYGTFALPDVKPGTYSETFVGWSESRTLREGEVSGLYPAGQAVTLKSGTTLYAVYAETYSKTRCILLANGGATASGAAGYVLDLTAAESRPEPGTLFKKDGFLLTGWNTRPDGSGSGYSSDDLRYAFSLPGALYAQWQTRPASGVLYHGNGSDSFGGASETVWAARPENGLADLGDQGFKRSYCTFLGWSTSPDGFPEAQIAVPEGALVELYAVWGFHATATNGNFKWIAGPVQLGTESGATQAAASGAGWRYDAKVFLDERYPGGAIRTTNDLYLYVEGDVHVDSIACGGTCYLEFADNASLTIPGEAYGITAEEVQIGRFGSLTVCGSTAAVSGAVKTTANLLECTPDQARIVSGAENTIRTGESESTSRTAERYDGEKWLNVEGKTITVTYVNGSSRDARQQKLLHKGVPVACTPEAQDGRTFMGWALNAQGRSEYYYEGDIYSGVYPNVADVTFYAQWAKTGDEMIYLNAGSGTVNGSGSTTLRAGSDGLYTMPEAKGDALFLGWMKVPYDGTFPGWNKLAVPEFDRSRSLIEDNALLWSGERYALEGGAALVAVWNSKTIRKDNYHVCKGGGGKTQQDSSVALVQTSSSGADLLTYIGMEKEGYFLTGWRAEDGKLYGIGDSFDSCSGKKFTAQWQRKQPGMAMLYGGIGRVKNKQSYLQTTDLNAADAHGFERAGCAFDGWYAHGETAPADELKAGRAYLAHWKAYRATYYDSGRTWYSDGTVSKHEILQRKDGTLFNGWNTEPDGSGQWFAPGTPLTGDLTLYAQYLNPNGKVLLFVAEGWFGGQNFRLMKALDDKNNTYELPKLLDGKSVLTWCVYDEADSGGEKQIRQNFRSAGKQTIQPGTVVRAILPGGTSLAEDEILLFGNGGTIDEKQQYRLITATITASDLVLANFAFSKPGVTQTGWNTKADGSGQSFGMDESVLAPRRANVNMLYAQWQKRVVELTVDGQTYRLWEDGASCFNRGWTCSLRDDVVMLSLHDYQGGAISIAGGEGLSLEILALGENTITAEQTAAIDAPGMRELWFEESSNQAGTLYVTGTPAVSTDAAVTLEMGGLTLENPSGGTCAKCAGINVNEKVYELKKTLGTGGVTQKLETTMRVYTLTLHGNGGTTADGEETVTRTAHYGDACIYPELFTRSYYVFTGWKNEPVEKTANRSVKVIGDMELYASWRQTQYPVTALFYDYADGKVSETEVEVKDGSCVVPPLPEHPGEQALYWYYRDADGIQHPCLPGERVPLQTSRLFAAFSMPEDSSGIVFHPNGGTLGGHKQPITNYGCLTTQSWSGLNGEQLLSWNTKPDGTGTSYAASGAAVPGADEGWVVLFAQWVNQDEAVYVTFWNTMVERDQTHMTLRVGDTFTFPEPEYPADLDVTFVGWRNDTVSSGDDTIYHPGDTYTVRSKDLPGFNSAWTINDTYMIDGKSYPCPDGTQDFYAAGDGWYLSVYWDGQAYLELYDYHGGAIDFPGSLLVHSLGDCVVTGAAGQSAIRSGRWLSLDTGCTKHHSHLDLIGGAGAAAASGKAVTLYNAYHVTMTGGISAETVFGETQIWGGADRASAKQLKSWEEAKSLAYVETRPSVQQVTVYGNGGTTADGETTKTLLLDRCLVHPLARTTGFTRPGYALIGYHDCSTGFQNTRPAFWGLSIDSLVKEIELVWQKVDYAHWIAFSNFDHASSNSDHDANPNSFYTFFDNSQPVTAPDAAAFRQSDFVCWQTDPDETGEPVHQYFPGETVTEKDGTFLTGMYVSSAASLVLYGNGKTYSDGTRVKVSFCAAATADDGTQPLSWNTRPDGTGETYPVGWWKRSLRHYTPPLRLYAQWEESSEPELPTWIRDVLPAIAAAASPTPTDVAKGDWFYADVQYVLEKGLMKGVGTDRFAPEGTLTRAMIVTILHRIAQTPAAASEVFSDVAAGSYYASAVAWAAQNGIVTGMKPGVFAPDENLTRGQLAAILYRFAAKQGYPAQAPADAPFADVPHGSYYEAAVAWAVQNGIVTGMKPDVFAPDAPVTRAQAAAILHRFCVKYRLF